MHRSYPKRLCCNFRELQTRCSETHRNGKLISFPEAEEFFPKGCRAGPPRRRHPPHRPSHGLSFQRRTGRFHQSATACRRPRGDPIPFPDRSSPARRTRPLGGKATRGGPEARPAGDGRHQGQNPPSNFGVGSGRPGHWSGPRTASTDPRQPDRNRCGSAHRHPWWRSFRTSRIAESLPPLLGSATLALPGQRRSAGAPGPRSPPRRWIVGAPEPCRARKGRVSSPGPLGQCRADSEERFLRARRGNCPAARRL